MMSDSCSSTEVIELNDQPVELKINKFTQDYRIIIAVSLNIMSSRISRRTPQQHMLLLSLSVHDITLTILELTNFILLANIHSRVTAAVIVSFEKRNDFCKRTEKSYDLKNFLCMFRCGISGTYKVLKVIWTC